MHYDPFYDSEEDPNSSCRKNSPFKDMYGENIFDWVPSHLQTLEPSTFGHYGCDSPKALVDLMMDKMNKIQPDVDVILVSGDYLAHGFAAKDEGKSHMKEIKETLKYVFVDILSAKFPNAIILPALGNNDIKYHYRAPTQDDDAPEYYSYFADVLFNQVSGNKKIDSEMIKQDFLTRGYYRYDYDFPTYSDGYYLSFLSLNSLYYNLVTPSTEQNILTEQLDWLEHHLSTAEDDRKFVIFFHIYPGEYQVHKETYFWDEESTTRFINIVETYDKNVAIILGAHTHFSDVRINSASKSQSSKFLKSEDSNDDVAKMAILITPSITPIFLNNPGFTTFKIEDNFVRDVKMTFFNLDLFPESAGDATFNQLDYEKELGIETFTPKHVEEFMNRLEDSWVFFYRYLAHKVGFRGILEPFGVAMHYMLGSIGIFDKTVFMCASKYIKKDEYHKCIGS